MRQREKEKESTAQVSVWQGRAVFGSAGHQNYQHLVATNWTIKQRAAIKWTIKHLAVIIPFLLELSASCSPSISLTVWSGPDCVCMSWYSCTSAINFLVNVLCRFCRIRDSLSPLLPAFFACSCSQITVQELVRCTI